MLQVVHDCRNDSAALYFQYDILVKNVFDTQVTDNNNLVFDNMHLALHAFGYIRPKFLNNARIMLSPKHYFGEIRNP